MIEEDLDDSEDIIMSQNSPDENKLDEETIITDFSSPLKAEQDTIAEFSSPEVNLYKACFSGYQHSKRKRNSRAKRSLDVRKRPSLSINISKKSQALNEDSCFLDNPTPEFGMRVSDFSNEDDKISEVTDDEQIDTASTSLISEIIEDNNDEASHSQILQIEEISPEIIESIDTNSDSPSYLSISRENKIKEHHDAHQVNTSVESKKETNDMDCSSFTLTKAPKKGSLLERALKVNSLMKKEAILYNHELNVGLRTSRGSFVSDVLVVQNIYSENTFNLLQCVTQNFLKESSENSEVEHIFIMISKTVNDVFQNCHIVVHFPVITLFDLSSKCHLIFAFNRVQVISPNASHRYLPSGQKVDWDSSTFKERKIFTTLKNRGSKNILDAVFGHLLIHETTLQLEILHVQNIRSNSEVFLKLLATDSDNQCCFIQLKHFDSLSLQIGCIFTFIGFVLKEVKNMTKKMKDVVEYYSSKTVVDEIIYLFEPTSKDYSVTFTRKSDMNRSPVLSSWHEALQKSDEEKRFKLAIVDMKICKSKYYIREQSLNEFIYLNCESQDTRLNFPSKKPFLLSGVYFKKGVLCFDEFSQIEPE